MTMGPKGGGREASTAGSSNGRSVTAASTDAVDEALKTRTMDEAPVGITIADATKPDMPLVYANASFERITGYPPEYAIGRNCRFLQGEGTRDEPVARMRAAQELLLERLDGVVADVTSVVAEARSTRRQASSRVTRRRRSARSGR